MPDQWSNDLQHFLASMMNACLRWTPADWQHFNTTDSGLRVNGSSWPVGDRSQPLTSYQSHLGLLSYFQSIIDLDTKVS